jgi:hypothetical protein
MLASVRDSCARAGIRGRRRGNIVLVAYQIIIIEGSTRCSVPLHMDVLDLEYERKNERCIPVYLAREEHRRSLAMHDLSERATRLIFDVSWI